MPSTLHSLSNHRMAFREITYIFTCPTQSHYQAVLNLKDRRQTTHLPGTYFAKSKDYSASIPLQNLRLQSSYLGSV